MTRMWRRNSRRAISCPLTSQAISSARSRTKPTNVTPAFSKPKARSNPGTGRVSTRIARFDISQPVVFYYSANTPPEYVEAVKDGILYWNTVFGREVVKAQQGAGRRHRAGRKLQCHSMGAVGQGGVCLRGHFARPAERRIEARPGLHAPARSLFRQSAARAHCCGHWKKWPEPKKDDKKRRREIQSAVFGFGAGCCEVRPAGVCDANGQRPAGHCWPTTMAWMTRQYCAPRRIMCAKSSRTRWATSWACAIISRAVSARRLPARNSTIGSTII